MASVRHLSNAPISEALIDIRVKARRDFSPTLFHSALADIRDRYPIFEEQHRTEIRIDALAPKTAPQSEVTDEYHGLFAKTSDRLDIAQFRADGFTSNRLRPYTSWEDVFPRSMELWRRYAAIAQPEAVTRLALRYINRVPLPNGAVDYDDYLTAAPTVPPELPQFVSGFASQVVIHASAAPDESMGAALRQVLELDVTSRSFTIVLDIDTFVNETLEPDSPAIPERFGALRDFKNRIFFSCITERLAKEFE